VVVHHHRNLLAVNQGGLEKSNSAAGLRPGYVATTTFGGCQKAVPATAAVAARSHAVHLPGLKQHTEVGDWKPYVQRRAHHRQAHCSHVSALEMLHGLTTVLLASATFAWRVQILLVAWMLGPKWQPMGPPCWQRPPLLRDLLGLEH